MVSAKDTSGRGSSAPIRRMKTPSDRFGPSTGHACNSLNWLVLVEVVESEENLGLDEEGDVVGVFLSRTKVLTRARKDLIGHTLQSSVLDKEGSNQLCGVDQGSR